MRHPLAVERLRADVRTVERRLLLRRFLSALLRAGALLLGPGGIFWALGWHWGLLLGTPVLPFLLYLMITPPERGEGARTLDRVYGLAERVSASWEAWEGESPGEMAHLAIRDGEARLAALRPFPEIPRWPPARDWALLLGGALLALALIEILPELGRGEEALLARQTSRKEGKTLSPGAVQEGEGEPRTTAPAKESPREGEAPRRPPETTSPPRGDVGEGMGEGSGQGERPGESPSGRGAPGSGPEIPGAGGSGGPGEGGPGGEGRVQEGGSPGEGLLPGKGAGRVVILPRARRAPPDESLEPGWVPPRYRETLRRFLEKQHQGGRVEVVNGESAGP